MNPELIAQYDAAVEALDAFAAPEAEDVAALEGLLARDVASDRDGSRDWYPRWVLAPLGALRVFAALQRGMQTALVEAGLEVSWLEQELGRSRGENPDAKAERLAHRLAELLPHRAALAARLEGEGERQVGAARERVARRLGVALCFAAQEAARSARDTLRDTSARVQRVLCGIEGYERLAAEARSLACNLELPCFRPEDVARVRAAAGLSAIKLEVAPARNPLRLGARGCTQRLDATADRGAFRAV